MHFAKITPHCSKAVDFLFKSIYNSFISVDSGTSTEYKVISNRKVC